MKTKLICPLLVLAAVSLVVANLAHASSVPQLINYQGRLTNAAGQPLTGPVTMVFALFESATPGPEPPLWSETQNSVQVNQGIYNILLGSVNPLPASVFKTQPVFLEISVNGQILSPRTQITSVAYAQNAQMLGGKDASEYVAYRRTIVVSPEPGDAAASGARLLAALAQITDASQYNRYLLKLEPGYYYLNTASLNMKWYVDLEGSGEKLTVIYSDVSFSDTVCNGTVNLADETELRFLTVQNSLYDNPASATAICAGGVTSAKLLHVTAVAGGNLSGTYYGIYNHHGSSYEMDEVKVFATAFGADCVGVYNFRNSSPHMERVTVTVSHDFGVGHYVGVYNLESSSPVMNNVRVLAQNAYSNIGVKNSETSSPTITNSTIETFQSYSGMLENIAIYNYDFSVPQITDCIIYATSAAGGTQIGIYNYLSPPYLVMYPTGTYLKDLTLKISGGDNSTNTGFKNERSVITMDNSRIDVTSSDSGGRGYGIYNKATSNTEGTFRLSGSVINVTGGLDDYSPVAMLNYNNCHVKIASSTLNTLRAGVSDDSIVIAQEHNRTYLFIDHSILSGLHYINQPVGDDSYHIYIGSSQLNGYWSYYGGISCAACYDGLYQTLEAIDYTGGYGLFEVMEGCPSTAPVE
jgi:hypothetical protein